MVKEVLTETPTSSIFAAISNSQRDEDPNAVKPPHKVSATTPPTSVKGCRYGLGGRSEGEEGASEIYSASESFSVSTTLTEKRDVGAEDLQEETTSALRKRPSTKRRPPDRSPSAWKSYNQHTRSLSSGDFPSRRRELKCGGVGGVKSSPSPVKRSSDRRYFPGRDPASTARQRVANGKVAAAGEARRGRGERSGRGRSASPVAKRVAAGGGGEIRGRGVANRSSPMRRKAGPGRASPEQTPRREEGDDCRQQQMMVTRGGDGGTEEEEREEAMPPAPVSEEMLENPLVSLECFIFL